MKLLNRMFRAVGATPDENIGGDFVTVSDQESVYVVGHKGLREFTSALVTVKMHKYLLDIMGENLKIQKITEDELYVTGKISGVQRQ